MKRLAWLTDIHLNFLSTEQTAEFIRQLAALSLDGLLITGDIAESHDLENYLIALDDALGIDIHFVLGNHDFYFSSISAVREAVGALCATRPRLHYLSTSPPIELASGVRLVGHDGWADARIGDYENSRITLNDCRLIGELAGLEKQARRLVLEALGDEAAAHIRRVLPQALAQSEEVVLLTHVPPSRESCWYEGQISDDEWAPHFTCQAVGETLLDVMREFPSRRLTVLCGHTHHSGEARPLENVVILTGGVEYGDPCVQRIFEFAE